MPHETVTELIYQYLRAVVHAACRDGAVGGLHEAFGLPAPDPDAAELDETAPGETGAEHASAAGATAAAPRPAALTPPAPRPGAAPGPLPVKRGRGRPPKPPTGSPPGGPPS